MNAFIIPRIARLCLLGCALLSTPRSLALDYEVQFFDQTLSTDGAVSVAVDRAGREHLVAFVTDASGGRVSYVRQDHNPAVPPAPVTLLTATTSAERVVHLSIDVSPNFAVVIAMITEGGALKIFEKGASQGSFSKVVDEGSVALGTTSGGVSIVAAGNGFSFHSAAYTASNGSLRFIQNSLSGWTTQVVTSASNTGLAPALSDTYGGSLAPIVTPRIIVSYDDAAKQVQASYYSLLSNSWQAPVPIETVSGFTRPDVDVFRGKLGVSYETSTTSGSTSTFLVRYAENSAASWALQTVASSSELGSLEFFDNTTCMRFDAAGNPMVSYQRDVFPVFALYTLDLRLRRYLPGIGWELNTVYDHDDGFTRVHKLVTDGAGDPVVASLVKSLGGGNSYVALFQAASRPWSCQVPPTLSNGHAHTFAPALATGPDGTTYLVAGVANQSSIFDPRSYLQPRLYAFKGSHTTETVIPSSLNPHVANAIAVGSDGVVHVVTLRVTSTSSVSGDLLYFRIVDGIATHSVAVDESGTAVGIASRNPIRLGIDDAGQLYLGYGRAAGGAALATLPPGSNLSPGQLPWTTVTTASGATGGTDLVVRGDGGYCFAYFNQSDRTIRSFSNVSLIDGHPVSPPQSSLVATLSAGSINPLNVACTFGHAQKPVFATCEAADAVRIYVKGALGIFAYDVSSGVPTPSTYVDLLYRDGFYDLCYSNATDGGSLYHVRMPHGGFLSPTMEGRICQPGVGPSGLGGDLVASYDAHGFPWMTHGFVAGGAPLFLFFDDILLARPADSLDLDDDGIPLLSEDAHCLANNFPDSHLLLPQSFVTNNGTNVAVGYSFRHPFVNSSFGVPYGTMQFGDFRYTLTTSEDLSYFDTPLIGAGSPLGTILPPPADGVGMRGFQASFTPTFRSTHPHYFARLTVSRER